MGTTEEWLATHTFHFRQFADTGALVARKQAQGLKVSLCIPTLNEAATIARVVEVLRPLRDQVRLVDDIAVIDSGSEDQTLERAASAGAEVYCASEILPEEGHHVGKGENLWKALFQLRGDILLCIDGDITTLHPGFVTGLLGPLLVDPTIGFVKAFYDRPTPISGEERTGVIDGGGRLTEILARPLLALWYPHLCGLIQPLAGEYAARRTLLEQVPFPVGYGVELAHLIDLAAYYGLAVFAQTDLGERRHRHRSNRQLGQSAHELLQVLFGRLRLEGKVDWHPEDVWPLRQFVRGGDGQLSWEIAPYRQERPPLSQMVRYRQRHQKSAVCPAIRDRLLPGED
jgi:glucosyl-3-phosphoglycerate synthase